MHINESFSAGQYRDLWEWRKGVVRRERGRDEGAISFIAKKIGAVGATEIGLPIVVTAAVVEGVASLVFSALCFVFAFWSASGKRTAGKLGERGLESLEAALCGSIVLFLNLVLGIFWRSRGDAPGAEVSEKSNDGISQEDKAWLERVKFRVPSNQGWEEAQGDPFNKEVTNWDDEDLATARAIFQQRLEIARSWDFERDFQVTESPDNYWEKHDLRKAQQEKGKEALQLALSLAKLIIADSQDALSEFIDEDSEFGPSIVKRAAQHFGDKEKYHFGLIQSLFFNQSVCSILRRILLGRDDSSHHRYDAPIQIFME